MKHLESQLQIACVKWFDAQYSQYRVLLMAIPNGHKRSKITAAILKREGVRAGVADLFLAKSKFKLYPVEEGSVSVIGRMNIAHGLFIEMKVGKGKQTDAQLAFEKAVTEQGYAYKVIRTFDEFQDIINKWLA